MLTAERKRLFGAGDEAVGDIFSFPGQYLRHAGNDGVAVTTLNFGGRTGYRQTTGNFRAKADAPSLCKQPFEIFFMQWLRASVITYRIAEQAGADEELVHRASTSAIGLVRD